VELTELIKDYVATELLSSIEIDFLEEELWETTQHIAEINTVIKAPRNICKKLGLDENSCWQLCCAAVLDSSRPLKNGRKGFLLENSWKNLTSKILSSHKSKHSKHCGFTIKHFSFFGHDFFCEFHNKVK